MHTHRPPQLISPILELLEVLDGGFNDCEGYFVNVSHNGMSAEISLDYGDGNPAEVYNIIPQRIR